jgi:peptidoglycan/xylan/chitin deacetylase (PgdA/CDA1 family)
VRPEVSHRTNTTEGCGRLTILMYHAIVRSPLALTHWCFLDERSFGRQIAYLREHFDVIGLSEAVRRLKDRALVRPTAVITFDDGFANTYDVAGPILNAAGLPATVFLTTGLIGTDDTLWFCRLNDALARTRCKSFEWDGARFDVSRWEARATTAATIQERLKKRSHPVLLRELGCILDLLGAEPDEPLDAASPYRMLSAEAVREMSLGRFEFGAHTHHHAILSRITPDERAVEIERSVEAVLAMTDRPCELFAYPNGKREDYDEETIDMLGSYGIRSAVTAVSGVNDPSTHVMELKRYAVGPETGIASFATGLQRVAQEDQT